MCKEKFQPVFGKVIENYKKNVNFGVVVDKFKIIIKRRIQRFQEN